MKRLSSRIKLVRHLFENMGPEWVLYRTKYAIAGKSGLLRRRFPTRDWDGYSLAELLANGVPTDLGELIQYRESSIPKFFPMPIGEDRRLILRDIAGERGVQRTIQIANEVLVGRILYYSRRSVDLGWPVNWLLNPFTGKEHECQTHWCDYPTFSAAHGDVKDVWEPSRFSLAFWLVRAYAMTADERYPSAFWELFESWCDQNPPNRGPNWKCGQETAIRVFAWCFALHGFRHSPSTTPDRFGKMIKAIAVSAQRIEGNIDYAISQKNNHGISEAVGLLTVGLVFPELKNSGRWLRKGRGLFEQELLRQVYVDGSFVQHSMNYHRVMLHDSLWAAQLCEIAGEPLDDEVLTRIERAGEWLFQMLDMESGRVPNYGSNDGALVLPLSSCDYRDFRETVQAALYFSTGRRCLPRGPWDEALLWLYGPEALQGDPTGNVPTSQCLDAGGYYTLRGQDSWCMMRCHSYRDRPAHVDPLHLDLWYRGVNILSDSGSYKYYCPESPEMGKYFKDISSHNTIEIDEHGPLDAVSRFLWLPWPTGRLLEFTDCSCTAEHDAYDREPWQISHRRKVQLTQDGDWVVKDDLEGEGPHKVVLRWHLEDLDWEVSTDDCSLVAGLEGNTIQISILAPHDATFKLSKGIEAKDRIVGWKSEHYGERSPRPTLEVGMTTHLPVTLVTRVNFSSERR